MLFQVHQHPILYEIVSRNSVKPDPYKLQASREMEVPKTKKDLQSFLS